MNSRRSIFVTLAVCLATAPTPLRADDKVPAKYQATVRKGLDYLLEHQHRDGHWEGDDGKYPVATTALAGMALLMEGSDASTGRHSAAIRRAADWLLAQSREGQGGLIYSGHPSEIDRYMYGHGLAVQFLSWAYYHECIPPPPPPIGAALSPQIRLVDYRPRRADQLRAVVDAAVRYIAGAQSSQGGWHRTSRTEGHDLDEVIATVIQVQALYTAWSYSGIDGSSAQDYLRRSLMRLEKDAQPHNKGRRDLEFAAALAGRIRFDPSGADLAGPWLTRCRDNLRQGSAIQIGRDELAQFYYAQVVFNNHVHADAPAKHDWPKYRTAAFDHLQSKQNADGSWPGPVEDILGSGPVVSTALWCTLLQFDNRRHPFLRSNIISFSVGTFH